jgi:hypothetical protein
VPPDSVRCTRTVQNQPSHSRVSSGALRYNSLDCLVHQRSNGYPTQRSTATTPDECNSARQSQSAPDCSVPLEDKASNGRQLPNPNGWVTWLAHPPRSGARFLSITFITRALAFTPRHNSKDQSLSKSPIHLKHLVTYERDILCSFELLPLGLPSSFLISFIK